MFQRVALIGIGLIGSSIARALRRDNLAAHISTYSRRQSTRDECAALNIVDSIHDNPADAVKGADLVVLCVHLSAYRPVMEDLAAALEPGAIITDVGSVKACVEKDIGELIPANCHLVPGHPISGTEKSGPGAGFAELFDNRWCILTPTDDTDPQALEKVKQLWQAIGSNVEIMDAGHHDLVLAVTSHLPHLIAYNIVGTAGDLEEVTQGEVVKYSAGGFRDFTRIAASDPTFWRDVFLTNKEAVIEVLGRFTEDLIALQRAIRWDQGDDLLEQFQRNREIRQRIIDAGQEIDAPDFGRRADGDD